MKWPQNVSLKAVISQPLLSHVLDPYKGNHPGVWKCKKKKMGIPKCFVNFAPATLCSFHLCHPIHTENIRPGN